MDENEALGDASKDEVEHLDAELIHSTEMEVTDVEIPEDIQPADNDETKNDSDEQIDIEERLAKLFFKMFPLLIKGLGSVTR